MMLNSNEFKDIFILEKNTLTTDETVGWMEINLAIPPIKRLFKIQTKDTEN